MEDENIAKIDALEDIGTWIDDGIDGTTDLSEWIEGQHMTIDIVKMLFELLNLKENKDEHG